MPSILPVKAANGPSLILTISPNLKVGIVLTSSSFEKNARTSQMKSAGVFPVNNSATRGDVCATLMPG